MKKVSIYLGIMRPVEWDKVEYSYRLPTLFEVKQFLMSSVSGNVHMYILFDDLTYKIARSEADVHHILDEEGLLKEEMKRGGLA